MNDLTSAELNPLSSDLELESKRAKLNLVYDGFVKKFGYLNENKNRKDIKQDLYGAKVLGLEKDFEKEITPRSAKMQNIEPRQAQAKKAQIFFERTLNPKKELIITNAKEALIASINQKGGLDLHFIRDHFKTQSLETTIKELLEQKLIYKDHKDNGDYILANDYLSGNVKRKLKEVKEAINQGVEGLEVNLKDLELIIPKDLKATEIMANINSPWIPTQYLEEFLMGLAANHYEKQYGVKMTDYQLGNLKENIKVEHLNGAYEVSIRSDELNELYGIRHKDKPHSYKAPFESLLNRVLNNKDLSVKYAQVDPNDPKKEIFITDEEQSNLARQKAEELKEAFKDWIYKDYARRTHLEQIYNDTFNNLVLKTYDGSQLELEGFNQYIKLRPHQKNAIFRTIQDGSVCLDHQVGAGKTLCAIASCMEQKRMGLVNKTLIAVPNHLIKQWGDEFYKAYPNANVLVVDSKDITEKERELLYNQIANNNYDAVIIAHTHLELLSNPREIIEGLKEEELVNAEKNFERQELAYKNNPRENKKPNERVFKNKLDKIRAQYDAILKKQGSHIDISQMGIDNLIVDEAHLFKNLAFETSMEKIAGLGNQQGSNRARDLFIKTRYLHQNDKKIMFLTGTPIANSLSEMYHLQRYLTPDALKERGLEFFDDWAKTYGEVVNDFELDTSAQSYKMVNRFSKFSDVLRHLVQMGIPQNEIAFIHDAKTEEQKQDLFKRVNRGEVRVLLGSPAKMGVGTNAQTRLVAMHELDCPWRPDELLQMEGRGIRQGNILHQNDPENFRMKIYRYATEKTYDSRMWQIIETKSKGIEQFRNAHKLGLNELEDFNMGSSNASEMKAEATGNPLIIEEVKLRAEIKSEESKYKAFNKEHYFNEENLKNNASKLDYLKQELKDLETLQSSVMIPTHTEIKLYDLKNEESKDYELIKVKEVEPLKENASMSEELTHKKLKEQNKQIAEQNKEKLDAIKKQFASNLNDLFFNEERDYKLLEYKGFVVNAYKTKYQVEFSLSPKDNPNIAYSPSNMVYKNDTGNMFSSYNFCGEVKFDGFLKRLDNAITKLPEKIKELENSIETTQENISKYTRLVEQKPSYPRLEYLQALKLDHKTLIDDLAKMGKDRDYKPAFNPKSKEVLEKMNAEKRASLENEREGQGVKGNTKSHDEIEPATEQVIEKEIEKGAEIIYSKEVATINNVDYYENEQEVEITKSRGRR